MNEMFPIQKAFIKGFAILEGNDTVAKEGVKNEMLKIARALDAFNAEPKRPLVTASRLEEWMEIAAK